MTRRKQTYIQPSSELIVLPERLMNIAPQTGVKIKKGEIEFDNIQKLDGKNGPVNQRWGVIDWGDGEHKNFEID